MELLAFLNCWLVMLIWLKKLGRGLPQIFVDVRHLQKIQVKEKVIENHGKLYTASINQSLRFEQKWNGVYVSQSYFSLGINDAARILPS